MIKVCHISTAHTAKDVRIFYKECKSLAKAGFDVKFIVINGESFTEDGVEVIGVPCNFSGRLSRFTKATREAYKKALEIDARIYHFHDPEFLPFASKLIKKGKKVIYDAHEDLPRQILSKYYIPKLIRKLISFFVEIYENSVCKKLTYIITATPEIENRFKKINPHSVAINNYPLIEELEGLKNDVQKENSVCYIGGISRIRGAKEMILAMKNQKPRLTIAGGFSENDLEEELIKTPGFENVDYIGFANRKKAGQVMLNSIAGLVVFHPEPNHINAQPNKIFEYMSAGIPVIGSDFPLWKQIIEKNNCGICVDPLNPQKIADAIQSLSENPEKAKQMGENGFQKVREKYNWAIEEKKLVDIYNSINN